MTTRISLLLTATCVLASACSDDGRATASDVTANTGTGSIGSDSTDTATSDDPTPTTSPTTQGPDPSGGTPGTASDSSDTDPTGGTGTTTVDPSAGTTMTGDDTTTGEDTIVEVVIDPLDAIVTVIDGQIPAPLQYTAKGITKGGDEVPIDGSWGWDRLDLASLGGQSGSFTVNGLAGGQGTVSFDPAGDLPIVKTSATVKLQFTSEPEPVDPAVKNGFGMAIDPDPAMTLVYPYDETVFPRGLTGPTIQWNGAGADDLYYIHVYSDFFDFKAYTKLAKLPARYDFPKLPADVWLKLTASTEGQVKFDIQRFDGLKHYLAKTQTWTIAPANLTGAVYYWEVNNGNVVRLNIGDTGPQAFIEKPQGVGCVACHSVSKDGSRIAAAFHGGYSPWNTIDAATGKVLYFPDLASGFQAISPNGSHVLWGQSDETGALKLTTYDSKTVLSTLTVPGGKPVHPVWSGDGSKVAFARKTDGNWLDFNNSELWLADIDLMTNTFSNVTQIVDKAPPLGTTTFPTFAPDSQWIAFNRLNQARTRAAVTEVWMTNLDGSATVRLDKANGVGIIEPGQDQTTYEPTFLPVSVGGYYWLIIGSERKYGNTLVDTNPNSRRKQLWVTAIDANIEPGKDPSHPAFWLPGQELNNSNMRGEWALAPCKQIGEGCNAGFDCCGGFCYPPAEGEMPTCNDTPDTCSHLGDSCEVDAACCEGEGSCIGGFCAIMPG